MSDCILKMHGWKAYGLNYVQEDHTMVEVSKESTSMDVIRVIHLTFIDSMHTLALGRNAHRADAKLHLLTPRTYNELTSILYR